MAITVTELRPRVALSEQAFFVEHLELAIDSLRLRDYLYARTRRDVRVWAWLRDHEHESQGVHIRGGPLMTNLTHEARARPYRVRGRRSWLMIDSKRQFIYTYTDLAREMPEPVYEAAAICRSLLRDGADEATVRTMVALSTAVTVTRIIPARGVPT